jgi:Tol biopolymer transport system component
MIKKIILITLISISVQSVAYSKDTPEQIKMVLAKQKLYAGQYTTALNMYKEILIKSPQDVDVLFYIGYCHFELKKYDLAEEFLLKVLKIEKGIKPETYLILGKLNLLNENIDKALEHFSTFKTISHSKEVEMEEVDLYIAHCNNAKKMMADKKNMKVENLGLAINSIYDDQTPCITADGSTLVYTTRRPQTTDSPKDIEGDGKYFQDIYLSTYDTVAHKWLPSNDAPGNINTLAHDACTSISPDGKQLFLYKNDVNDSKSRGGNIFVSKIISGKWKTPEVLDKPINSSYWEGGACISPDGKTLFFISERSGGFGRADIWMAKRINKKEWGKPINLGPEINSEFDEVGAFLAPDGKTLFFSSNGKGSMGSYDIFKTTLNGDTWSKPINLGFPINTVYKDGPLVLSADNKLAYFASDRKGGIGESDLYSADISEYNLLEVDGQKKINTSLSILKGTIRDGFEGSGLPGVDIQILDSNSIQQANLTTTENGEYFITLKGNEFYTIKIVKKGYKTLEEKVELKRGINNTFSLEKQFMLNKEK